VISFSGAFFSVSYRFRFSFWGLEMFGLTVHIVGFVSNGYLDLDLDFFDYQDAGVFGAVGRKEGVFLKKIENK